MILRLFLLFFILIGISPAQSILDERVPTWARFDRVTLGEAVERMRGWAEGGFEKGLPIQVPREIRGKMVKLRIKKDPHSTFRELLTEAFQQAGKQVVFEGDDKIKMIELQTRRWNIIQRIGEMKRNERWSAQAIKVDLATKKWTFSKYFRLNLMQESGTLIVSGTEADINKIVRYMGL